MVWIKLGAAVLVLMLVSSANTADEPAKVEVGKPAPDFTLKDHEGKESKLSAYRGKKNVLVAFYPKDFTGG